MKSPPPPKKKVRNECLERIESKKNNGCNEDYKQWIHEVVEPKKIEISIEKNWICRFHVM